MKTHINDIVEEIQPSTKISDSQILKATNMTWIDIYTLLSKINESLISKELPEIRQNLENHLQSLIKQLRKNKAFSNNEIQVAEVLYRSSFNTLIWMLWDKKLTLEEYFLFTKKLGQNFIELSKKHSSIINNTKSELWEIKPF